MTLRRPWLRREHSWLEPLLLRWHLRDCNHPKAWGEHREWDALLQIQRGHPQMVHHWRETCFFVSFGSIWPRCLRTILRLPRTIPRKIRRAANRLAALRMVWEAIHPSSYPILPMVCSFGTACLQRVGV